MDPLELRRRNVLHRSDLPYVAPAGHRLVEVSPEETLEQAAQIVDYDAFRAEQAAARAEGRLIGLGISLYVEPQPTMGVYGTEPAHIRVQPNGMVDVYVGSGSHGQGIETTTAELVSDHLGVALDDIAVHQGDTAETPYAFGTGGSRSGPVLGAAIRQTSLLLREKVALIAAQLLEAAPDDIEVIDSTASVRGTPTKSVTLRQSRAGRVRQPRRAAAGDGTRTGAHQPVPLARCHVLERVSPLHGRDRSATPGWSRSCATSSVRTAA